MSLFQGINSLGDLIKKIEENKGRIIAILSMLLALAVGIYGYCYYKQQREEKAYRALVTSLEYFDAPFVKDGENKDDLDFLSKKEFKTAEEKWKKVDEIFKGAYKSHGSSGLASFFLAYRSQALLELKDLPKAIELLRLSLSDMPNGSVKEYYKSKLALMLIDTKSANGAGEGIKILKQLALDDTNVAHDRALYHLGEYYWHEKKFSEAKNYWNQLVLKYGKQERYPSPWVEPARDKLRLIDLDVK